MTQFGETEITPNSSRLLIPINDPTTVDKLCSWLANKEHLWNAEILLLQIIRPNWFDTTPYTANQALALLDEQDSITAQIAQHLASSARQLTLQYPKMALYTHVKAAPHNSETITTVASEFKASLIVFFCEQKNPLTSYFEKRLTLQITNQASCPLYVVEAPKNKSKISTLIKSRT